MTRLGVVLSEKDYGFWNVAWCGCGWQGEDRDTAAEALEDAAAHRRATNHKIEL